MKRLLFVCVHNAGRSQMAAAFVQHLAREPVEAESAGTLPTERVNHVVVDAMQEKGLDLSPSRPKLLTQEMADRTDRVITMGCSIQEACPATLTPAEDWGLEDPHGKPIAVVRGIRDQIEARVKRLLAELGVPSVSSAPSKDG